MGDPTKSAALCQRFQPDFSRIFRRIQFVLRFSHLHQTQH